MNYPDAKKKAEEIRDIIAPFCLLGADGAPMCQIAGSVRRQKQEFIKDIEVVGVPDTRKLFELREIVNNRWGKPAIGAFPSKYTRIRSSHNLDLFWPSIETYGLVLFIRTGSREFVTKALVYWKSITQGGYSEDAQLHRKDGAIVPTPTEELVFKALGWKWVEPKDRI